MILKELTKTDIEEAITDATHSIKAIVQILQTIAGEGLEINRTALYFSLQAIRSEAEKIEDLLLADELTVGEIRTIAKKQNLAPDEVKRIFFNSQTA